jgi:hypothetical protein
MDTDSYDYAPKPDEVLIKRAKLFLEKSTGPSSLFNKRHSCIQVCPPALTTLICTARRIRYQLANSTSCSTAKT